VDKKINTIYYTIAKDHNIRNSLEEIIFKNLGLATTSKRINSIDKSRLSLEEIILINEDKTTYKYNSFSIFNTNNSLRSIDID
jgi:hypothetical protein